MARLIVIKSKVIGVVSGILLFLMVIAAAIIFLPFLTTWVWRVVIPGCFPGIVEKGYLAATISWKVAFCMTLVPLPTGAFIASAVKWLRS